MKTGFNKNKIKYIAGLALIVGFGANVCFALASEVTKDQIIGLVNQEREKAGLNELKENEALDKAAGLKAQDMIGNNYFAHTSPEGVDPWHWFGQVGYQYKYAGENLAMDFTSATSVHNAWMKSQSHKDNIMSEKYQEIGVAIMNGVIENRETKVAVQLFGTQLNDVHSALANEIKEEEADGVSVEEASVYPWKETVADEMLVYAKVSGEPENVFMTLGQQNFELVKHRDGIYMNLFSLDEMKAANEGISIVAKTKDNQMVFYQVPQNQYIGYFNNAEPKKEEIKPMATVSGEEIENLKRFTKQNLMLAVATGVFVVLIINIWILEKEEEKLLKNCLPA